MGIQVGPADLSSFFRGLPAITWCWTIQFNVLPVYNSIADNGQQRVMSHVSYYSVVSLFVYYCLFGFASLIIWGSQVNDDFISNLDYKDKNYVFYFGMELSTTTQFILALITFSSIPMFSFEARTNSHYILMDIWNKCCVDRHHFQAEVEENSEEDTPLIVSSHDNDQVMNEKNDLYKETILSRFLESAFIIVSAAIVALYLTNLNWCLSLVGATYGCYIAYLMPSIVYWQTVKNIKQLSMKRRVLKYLSVVSIVYGVIVCVFGIGMSFV